MLDLVEAEFVGRYATSDADVEPAMAQVIEHANFLDHAQRRVERQQIDERPEPQPLGHAGHRTEVDAGHRHHVERRGMVLGHVQAIEASLVRRGGELQPLVEQRRHRSAAMLDVIEKPDLHVGEFLPLRCFIPIPPRGRPHLICRIPAKTIGQTIKAAMQRFPNERCRGGAATRQAYLPLPRPAPRATSPRSCLPRPAPPSKSSTW